MISRIPAYVRSLIILWLLVLPVQLYARTEPPAALQHLQVTPTLAEAVAAVHTVQILSRNAYHELPLNRKTSGRFFDAYVDALDPQHMFFLHEDIKTLGRYRRALVSDLKSGRITPGFIIFERYRERYTRYLQYMLAGVKAGLAPAELTTDATLQTDRKDSPWLTDEQAQKALWHKQLVNNFIVLTLNGKSRKAIQQQLTKRYQNQMRTLQQTHSSDVFQMYLNAFTMLYDPHTQYFSPSRMQNFNIDMSLSLEGIGAVLQADGDYTKVASVVPGGPAAREKQLKPGDKIVAVAQGKRGKFEDIVGMRLDDVVQLIRGAKGTFVRLEVIPGSQESGKTFISTIRRDKVSLEEQAAKADTFTVPREHRNYRIGVLRVPAFYLDFNAARSGVADYRSTTRDVRALLKKLQGDKVDGIIIDLRGNGGGSLQEAIELTSLFIPAGPAVIVRDNRGHNESQMDTADSAVYSGPLTVMVNRLSASASEIFAGAMKDYRRALITGSRTFGKGTVQTLQPLNDGQLKLTIAKFYRVSGQSTQNRGVIPDIRFPALFDDKVVGESSYPDALPWDAINPSVYTPGPSLTGAIAVLKQEHEERGKDLPYFNYIKALRGLDDEYAGRKTISLNLNERRKEFHSLREQQLAIENALRKARGKPPLKSAAELEKHQTAIIAAPETENPDKDAYLRETGRIMADYIYFQEHHKKTGILKTGT